MDQNKTLGLIGAVILLSALVFLSLSAPEFILLALALAAGLKYLEDKERAEDDSLRMDWRIALGGVGAIVLIGYLIAASL